MKKTSRKPGKGFGSSLKKTGRSEKDLSLKEAFHSSSSSIARARKHIGDLEKEILELNSTGEFYTLKKQPLGDWRRYVVKAKLKQGIPDHLESIATDAIYNLRASLDQAIYSAARVARQRGVKNINLGKNCWKFPIGQQEKAFEQKLGELERKGFLTDVIEIIRAAEPCKEESLLFALNEAANVNKHRFLTPTDLRASHLKLELISGPSTVGPPALKHFEIGGSAHNVRTVSHNAPVAVDELGLYEGLYSNPTEYKVKANIDIQFRGIKGLEGKSCAYQLRLLADSCESIVQDLIDVLHRSRNHLI